jgi:cytochrome c-type biogenesis protein CcmF
MLSNFGSILIIFTLLTSLVLIKASITDLKIINNFVSKKIYRYSLCQSTFIITSFFTLITSFIVSDFSVINVFQNSHSSKPLFYKIVGAWGNHEGSLLLWINILIIFSYFFLIFNKNSKKNYRLYTIIVQNFLIIGFLVFLLINSNPFSPIYPVPSEGLGLNPILQDPALAIHPPLLYIGFVGSSIYFSAAISSLLTQYKGKSFASSIKSWVLISWSFQTLGIIVGSIWAYYELGWGGFWFWDPVENASLLPWFAITALMHSLILLEKRNTAYYWTIILCLLAFTLSVTGTFLVRSGILNSVHTFANDPSRGVYMLVFLTGMILASVTIFFTKYKKENYNFSFKSKETFILINNWFMAFFLITVLIGTIYPIFSEVLTETKISVGPPYYNIVIIPLVVPFLILMALGPNTRWIKNNYIKYNKHILIFLFAILINILIFVIHGSYSILSSLITITSLFLIISSLVDALNIKDKISRLDFSRIVSHLGFGLMVFFIGINYNFSIEEDFNLKIGEEKNFKNFQIKFSSLEVNEKKNYKTFVGKFEVIDKNLNKKKTLKPEIRIYNQPVTLTYEASIRTNFSYDTYLTMSNISRSDYYNIKFQRKPFMLWIWISALLISIGGFLRLIKTKKNYEKKSI